MWRLTKFGIIKGVRPFEDVADVVSLQHADSSMCRLIGLLIFQVSQLLLVLALGTFQLQSPEWLY